MIFKKNLIPAKESIITGQEEELIFSKRNFRLFWDTMDIGKYEFYLPTPAGRWRYPYGRSPFITYYDG
jgi:hypothetical protein